MFSRLGSAGPPKATTASFDLPVILPGLVEKTGYAISVAKESILSTFDICDGKNQYKPCPKCHSEIDMGLSTKHGNLAVQCLNCGHRGPEITVPPLSDPQGRDMTYYDQVAFDRWNQQEA